MIRLQDKTIMCSVHTLSKNVFLSKLKLALFTLYKYCFINLVKNTMLSDSVLTEGVIF